MEPHLEYSISQKEFMLIGERSKECSLDILDSAIHNDIRERA
jgi:hypothetical protein